MFINGPIINAPIVNSLIVNALGGLDNPNADVVPADALQATSDEIVVDERTLADAKASGLTAVNITLGYVMGDLPPYEHTLHEIEVWDSIIGEHPRDLLKVLTADDIVRAGSEGKIGVIYGFQNAVQIGTDTDRIASRVRQFADLGVRVVQLTYNQANHLGDGSMAPQNRGLTPFGREVVGALNEANLMVDLSHSGQNTCLDAARHSSQPVSVNHTGCRAVTDLPRNKTDEELRLVADKGGFVGIYFMPYLNPTGHATAADVVEHIVHAVNVCGEDHVGIGTDGPVTPIDDLDAYRTELAAHTAARAQAGVAATGEGAGTFPFVLDLRGVGQFRELARLLQARGYTSSRVEKILGRNFYAYAARIWSRLRQLERVDPDLVQRRDQPLERDGELEHERAVGHPADHAGQGLRGDQRVQRGVGQPGLLQFADHRGVALGESARALDAQLPERFVDVGDLLEQAHEPGVLLI